MMDFITKYLFHDTVGAIHLFSSILSLFYGTQVLISQKGDERHRKRGKKYLYSMAVLLITSFMIYRITGAFGIFHYAAIFAIINLLLGMVPLWLKRPRDKWKFLHLNFMYWSIIGLYMAFASEIATRLPNSSFYFMVMLASGGTLLLGFVIFYIKLPAWKKIFKIK